MRRYEDRTLLVFYLAAFLLISSLFCYFHNSNLDDQINKELERSLERLQLNYDMTQMYRQQDVASVKKEFDSFQIIPGIMDAAYGADIAKQAELRQQLYEALLPVYESLTMRGYLQVQFLFPDNISFLRVHKPDRYGDDLSNTRYTFRYTNMTHLPISGFEQGRTEHGFRNVFPIFTKEGKYVGAYELSFSSESLQQGLIKVNKIHSHFLVHKSVFEAKQWERMDVELNYLPSIENNDYYYTTFFVDHKRRAYVEKHIIGEHKALIGENMLHSKKFAVYTRVKEKVVVIAFIPILDAKGKTAAYLVSYAESPVILHLLKDYITILWTSILTLGVFMVFLFRLSVYKRSLERQTKEQNELLSLFDKGDTTIFKWRLDPRMSVSYVSSNVRMLTGYTREEFETKQIDFFSIVHEEEVEHLRGLLEQISKDHVNVFKQVSYRIVTRDGKHKWLLSTSQVIDDQKGRPTHLLGYATDITQIKDQELSLKESRSALEELTQNLQKRIEEELFKGREKDRLLQEQSKLASMGEMVGAIAHQWRQPLNALSINIQNLEDDFYDGLIDKKFVGEFIDKQISIIDFMSQTIDDFRNFFKVNKQKIRFSVREAIETTVSMQKEQLANHNIQLTISGEDFSIFSLKSELQQVILNLISNAKDAIGEKKIRNGHIDIRLGDKSIIVSDNGGGIDEKVAGRIFEPYFTTKEEGKGVGIGLYMSRMIVEQNIGGILEFSNGDEGAVFTIRFTV